MVVEDYTLNLSPIRQNINAYPREDNFCSDDYSQFLQDDGHLHETAIPDNKDLGSNSIPKIRDSVLPSPRIAGTKYRVYSDKIDTATNITIHKTTERIKFTTILGVTYDEGVIRLIINLKCMVIVVDTGSPFQTTPHSTGLDFYETNIKDSK